MKMLKPRAAARIRSKAHLLMVGDTTQPGDYLQLINGANQRVLYLIDEMDTGRAGKVITADHPTYYRVTPEDPMVTMTKRIRAKTTLGKLEKLLADRAIARRRVTLAQTSLDTIEKRIAAMARALAESTFESELTRYNA